MRHKYNAKPTWACQHCLRIAEKPKSKKIRYCAYCDPNKERPDAVRWWDSQSELDRWSKLKLLERYGQISDLKVKPIFPFVINGTTLKHSYEADFEYVENGIRVIEDWKGVQTEVFRLKKELVEILYPGTKITIIKAGRR